MTTSSITNRAPERLVVTDGTVWTLRRTGPGGEGRYAPERITECGYSMLSPYSTLVEEYGAKEPGPATEVRPKRPDLSFRTDAMWTRAVLRVDAIQHRMLTGIGAAWNESGGEDDIISAVTVLADVLEGDPSQPEVDAAVEAVGDAACLPDGEVELTLADALRLRAELDAAIQRLARFSSSAGRAA